MTATGSTWACGQARGCPRTWKWRAGPPFCERDCGGCWRWPWRSPCRWCSAWHAPPQTPPEATASAHGGRPPCAWAGWQSALPCWPPPDGKTSIPIGWRKKLKDCKTSVTLSKTTEGPFLKWRTAVWTVSWCRCCFKFFPRLSFFGFRHQNPVSAFFLWIFKLLYSHSLFLKVNRFQKLNGCLKDTFYCCVFGNTFLDGHALPRFRRIKIVQFMVRADVFFSPGKTKHLIWKTTNVVRRKKETWHFSVIWQVGYSAAQLRSRGFTSGLRPLCVEFACSPHAWAGIAVSSYIISINWNSINMVSVLKTNWFSRVFFLYLARSWKWHCSVVVCEPLKWN